MVIVNNARDMLEQSQHALDGSPTAATASARHCGTAIGKNRAEWPSRGATLC
jgi:hypothetical protein